MTIKHVFIVIKLLIKYGISICAIKLYKPQLGSCIFHEDDLLNMLLLAYIYTLLPVLCITACICRGLVSISLQCHKNLIAFISCQDLVLIMGSRTAA